MRNTKQKDLILQIINNSYNHPTANDVYEECKKTLPDISLGTVYRNLNIMADKGLIRRLKTPENADRFDRDDLHAHFICLNCGIIKDVKGEFLVSDIKIGDCKVMDYELNFRGLCEKCLEKEGEI